MQIETIETMQIEKKIALLLPRTCWSLNTVGFDHQPEWILRSFN